MKDLANYSLLAHNTFGIEARCRRFLEYDSVEEARQVASLLRQQDEPYIIIGGGSNLLLTSDFPGTVVHSAVGGMQLHEWPLSPGHPARLVVGSGVAWDEVVSYALDCGFGQLAGLTHIPGDVGASVVQNIGAYGDEVSRHVAAIVAVEIATGEMVTISASDCRYGYRDSRFKHEWKNRYLICYVDYSLRRDTPLITSYANLQAELDRRGMAQPTARQLRQVVADIRRAKLPDPRVEGNAGSFFTNPVVPRSQYQELLQRYPQMPHYGVDADHEKIPAAWLIDQCGWRGRTVGRAGVHQHQALVLVNRGGATGQDILLLCQAIQQDVLERFGIQLQPEVNIV